MSFSILHLALALLFGAALSLLVQSLRLSARTGISWGRAITLRGLRADRAQLLRDGGSGEER
jgi:hypothetical protein